MKKLTSRFSTTSRPDQDHRPPSPAPTYRTVDPARSPSPTPTYRTIALSSHKVEAPSDSHDLAIAPQYLSIVNNLAEGIYANPEYHHWPYPSSRLNYLLRDVRNTMEGNLRGMTWSGEITEDLSPETFKEIVNTAQALLVRQVLHAGGGIEVRTCAPTILHRAVEGKNVKAVAMLLDRGVKIDVQDMASPRECTALDVAAENGFTDIVRLLLERGARVNGVEGGTSPLSEAARNRQVDATRVLLEAGADVRTEYLGWTPLYEASLHGNAEVVKMLLSYGADVEGRTSVGPTALMEAAMMGRGEVARVLIEAGADVSSPTILYELARHGFEDVAILAVQNGADVNGKARRTPGTALHLAARAGLKDLVRVLLERGADVNVKDEDGLTPRDVALKNGHKGIAELIDSATSLGKGKEMMTKGEGKGEEFEDDPPPPYSQIS